MGIKFRCHECDKKLHVKSFLAGKRGVCPRCGAKVRIPHASQDTSRSAVGHEKVPQEAAPVQGSQPAKMATGAVSTDRPHSAVTAPAVADPISESPEAVWYVRPPTGGQFGPADAQVMRRWLEEGRVSSDALVWREGWPDWKTAGPVFPSLRQLEDLPAESLSASTDRSAQEFAFGDVATPARGQRARTASTHRARNVVIVVVLSVLCVALLAALFYVLYGRS